MQSSVKCFLFTSYIVYSIRFHLIWKLKRISYIYIYDCVMYIIYNIDIYYVPIYNKYVREFTLISVN